MNYKVYFSNVRIQYDIGSSLSFDYHYWNDQKITALKKVNKRVSRIVWRNYINISYYEV